MSAEPVSFEALLLDQTLASEQLRLAVVAAFAAITYLLFLVAYFVSPSLIEYLFRGEFSPMWGGVIAASLIVGELGVRQVVGMLRRLGRRPLGPVPFVTASIEVSVPTALIFMLSRIFPPADALVTPPVLLYGVFIVLSALRLSPVICFFSGLLAGIEYAALSAYLLAASPGPHSDPVLTSLAGHVAKGTIFIAMGAISGLLTRQIRRGIVHSYETLEDRNRIVGVFGRHVSPSVVETLLDSQPELGGQLRPVCLMFLDIRNFTAHSEKSNPMQVVDFLNSLFGFMVAAVTAHGGIINKFLGDGFMAVFGAPVDDDAKCAHALQASREILLQLNEFNADRREDPVRIGIGLHTGQAVTGNVGSQTRREYTIIGDVVNVASRIEQLNKRFASSLLVSRAVLDELPAPPADAVEIGPVEVKGHEAPVLVYRLA